MAKQAREGKEIVKDKARLQIKTSIKMGESVIKMEIVKEIVEE